jgi:hypothetical protein
MGNCGAREPSRRLLTRIVAGRSAWRRETIRGFFEDRSPVVPLQNIHSFGRGEFAGAAEAVALGIVALGAGHRRREF